MRLSVYRNKSERNEMSSRLIRLILNQDMYRNKQPNLGDSIKINCCFG